MGSSSRLPGVLQGSVCGGRAQSRAFTGLALRGRLAGSAVPGGSLRSLQRAEDQQSKAWRLFLPEISREEQDKLP